MTENKQLTINLIAQITSFVLMVLVNFFLAPFIINNIGAEAYGFVGLANDFVNYAQIITIALNSMASRFITIALSQKNYKSANEYFTSVFFANILLMILLAGPFLLIILFVDKLVEVPMTLIFDVKILWTFIFGNFLMSIGTSVFGVAPFSKNKLYLESLRTMESNILRVLVLLLCFSFFIPKVWYVGIASVICTFYIFSVNVFYTKKLLPGIKIKKKHFNWRALKQILSSGIWNSFTKIGTILSSGLSLLISNVFIGASAMGILSITKNIPNVVLMAFGTIASVFLPQLTIDYAHGDIKKMKRGLFKTIKILGLFSSIPIAVLFVFGDIFFSLWVPTQDSYVLLLLTVLSCYSYVVLLPLEGLWGIFTIANKVKVSSIWLFCESLITILITLIFIKMINSMEGKLFILVGINSTVILIRSLTFLPLYGAYCLKVKWTTFYPAIIKSIFTTLIVIVIAILLKIIITIDSWLTLFFACIIVTIIAVIVNIAIVFSKEERENIKRKVVFILNNIKKGI